MSKKYIFLIVALGVVIGVAACRISTGASDLSRNSTAAYDGDKQIADALQTAKQEGKHVLVQSSAQGCTWCHVLNNLLTTNPELVTAIEKDFVYVVVDTSNDRGRAFYKKYAHNTEHTLVLTILDGSGKQLGCKIGFEIVEGNSPSENFHISPETMMAFLKASSPRK